MAGKPYKVGKLTITQAVDTICFGELMSRLRQNPDYQFSEVDLSMGYETMNNIVDHFGVEKVNQLYEMVLKEYATDEVLATLGTKNAEVLLREVVKQWLNYNKLQAKLEKLFQYVLDEKFIKSRGGASLREASHLILFNLVSSEMVDRVNDAVRNAGEGDVEIARNVENIFQELYTTSKKY